jgi:hypothetical protein
LTRVYDNHYNPNTVIVRIWSNPATNRNGEPMNPINKITVTRKMPDARGFRAGENFTEAEYDTLAGFIEAEYDITREIAENVDEVFMHPVYAARQHEERGGGFAPTFAEMLADDMVYVRHIADAYHARYYVKPMLK